MTSITSTLTMSTLIEEVLDVLHRPIERPRQVQVTAAVAANDATITADSVSSTNLSPTDILEFGRELMLVTAVSGTTVTVSRGYAGTVAAAYVINTLGSINPLYPRHVIDRSIRKCVSNFLQAELPCILTETSYKTDDEESMRWLDELMVDVLDVHYVETNGRISKIRGRWTVVDWLPPEAIYTGKALRVPRGYWAEDLIIVYSAKYEWTGSGESATLDVPLLSEDLPVLFTVAFLTTGMEISRQEFDQVEEFPQQQRNLRSANIRLIQSLWGQFFQQLDKAKSMQKIPVRMEYQSTPHRL